MTLNFAAQLPDKTPAPNPALKSMSPLDVIDQWRSEGPLIHQATGLEKLDAMTGGGPIYGSRWYLIGAPDSAKTTLLIQWLDTWARRGIAVGILAVDEDPSDIVTRLAQRAGWLRRECEERNRATLDEIAAELSALPIRIYGSDHTIESAALDIANYARSRGMRAALGIDSIQTASCNANVGEKADSLRLFVTSNVKALRAVATEYHLITVATSEMNRGAYRTVEAAEGANDLASAKESGAIEYSARVLVSLRNVAKESDLLEARVVKINMVPKTRSISILTDSE